MIDLQPEYELSQLAYEAGSARVTAFAFESDGRAIYAALSSGQVLCQPSSEVEVGGYTTS